MGNELSAFGGGILTIVSGIIAPSFFEACNDFTKEKAAKTNVRNGLEAVASLIALVGSSIIVGVTSSGIIPKFQMKLPKNMFWATGKYTFEAMITLIVGAFITVLYIAKGMPVLGHAIGLIHYCLKDAKGGAESLLSATRTLGVMGGGLLVGTGVLPGGPLTRIFCGICGGLSMDIMFTLMLTNIEGRFEPYGFLKAVHDLLEGFKTTNQNTLA